MRYGTAPRVDEALAARLAEIDRLSFPARLHYGAEGYLARATVPGAWLALAEEGSDLAGFCLAAPDQEDPSALFLDVLAVHPAWRRKGVAAQLVAMCLDHAREQRLAQVRLTCEPRAHDGADLVEVYRRLGFSLVERHEDHALMARDARRSPGSR